VLPIIWQHVAHTAGKEFA